MICPKCGKELIEGEICNCENANTYQEPIGAYYNPNAAQQSYYEAPQQAEQPNQQYYEAYQQPYYVPEEKEPAKTNYPEGYKIKKKYVAVILGFMFGAFGIHNFYLGNSTKAIAQVLLSTVGAITVVGPVISLVWSIVEAVLILTEEIDADADNYKIQTFEEALAEKLNK